MKSWPSKVHSLFPTKTMNISPITSVNIRTFQDAEYRNVIVLRVTEETETKMITYVYLTGCTQFLCNSLRPLNRKVYTVYYVLMSHWEYDGKCTPFLQFRSIISWSRYDGLICRFI